MREVRHSALQAMKQSPGRAWWKRKRWWLAAALLLVAAYPASVGPLGYGVGRGWVPRSVADAYVAPLGPSPFQPLLAYVRWWVELGREHAAQ